MATSAIRKSLGVAGLFQISLLAGVLVGVRLAPAQNPPPQLRAQAAGQSRLGIQGRFEYGYGMVVERVHWGGPASRIGLERGDVIRAIDGRWLRTENDYRRGLRGDPVSVQIVVEDVRTGRLISRPIAVHAPESRSARTN